MLRLSIALVACLFVVLPAVAGDEENREKFADAKRKMQELREHAKELAADGQHEAAAKARHKANDLAAGLERRVKYLKAKKNKKKKKRDGGPQTEAKEILKGLEQGIAALRRMGRHEEARHLEELAEGVAKRAHGKKRRGNKEREVAGKQLEVMRIALDALLKANKRDAAEMLERAMHARKLRLEGRRDEEARHVMERAPSRGQEAELLLFAHKLLRELGAKERAAMVGGLARQFAGHKEGRGRKEGRERERKHERRGEGHEAHRERIEILGLAQKAMAEAGKKDAADMLRNAIHALEVRGEGRRDKEALGIYKRAPGVEDQVELLRHAADLYKKWGHEERAVACDRLARQMLEHGGRREGRERRDSDKRRDRDEDRRRELVKEMQDQVRELARAIEELQEELERLKRRGR